MTALGWTCIAAAGVMAVYGLALALCNAARIGDEALDHLDDDGPVFQQFDVEPRYVAAEWDRIATELESQP